MMFETSAGRIDLSNFVTTSVNDMSNMFYHCESMTNLDIGNINIHVAGVTFNKEISKETNIESQEINSDEIKIDELIEEN